MWERLFWIIVFVGLAPFVVFLCVKFGTVAYYKGKEHIDKNKKLDTRTFEDFKNAKSKRKDSNE